METRSILVGQCLCCGEVQGLQQAILCCQTKSHGWLCRTLHRNLLPCTYLPVDTSMTTPANESTSEEEEDNFLLIALPYVSLKLIAPYLVAEVPFSLQIVNKESEGAATLADENTLLPQNAVSILIY